jgi:hypothetical protein
MTKLKKLFPISFKFTQSPLKLFLGILIYLVVNIVAAMVVDTVISLFMAPMLIFVIPYIGWALALLFLPFIIVYVTVLSYVNSIALSLLNIYVTAGIVVSFIAYAKSEGEEPEAVEESDGEAEETEDTEAEDVLPELESFDESEG